MRKTPPRFLHMNPDLHDNTWMNCGMSLLWDAQALNRVCSPEAVRSLREFLRLHQAGWPEDTLKLIMGKGPLAVKACIEAVYKGMDMDLDNALNLEAQLFGVVSSTADIKEGLTAFLEKRPARFNGE